MAGPGVALLQGPDVLCFIPRSRQRERRSSEKETHSSPTSVLVSKGWKPSSKGLRSAGSGWGINGELNPGLHGAGVGEG